MMLPSHLLATLLACVLLTRVRPLSRREWLLALAFGVAIDLDHLLQIPTYLAQHGSGALDPTTMSSWGAAWQGVMHTQWALAIVLPAVLATRSLLPAAFWGLHMVQDFVIARHYVRFAGGVEWAIVAALFALLLTVAIHDHRATGRGAAFHQHVLARVAFVWPRG